MLKKSRVIFIGILFVTMAVVGGCNSHFKAQDTQATTVIKGPYLIYPGNNTHMTILWQTENTAPCTLSWGTDTTYSAGNAVSSEYGNDHQHKYTIDGLTPGKKYYYRLAAGEHSYTGSFRAAPPVNAAAVEFLAYGDTRTHPERQNQVCGNIISTYTAQPNCQTFILHVGDWVSSNSEKDWALDFFDRSYTANTTMQADLPIQGCMGNHEGSGSVYEKYWPYPYAADRYGSFDYGPAHIVILDQYTDYSRESAQLTWLENDLRNSTKKWKCIVLHEPGWSAGSYHGNNTDVQANIQPLCEKYGVQIVFAGHNHYYARAAVNGVQHLTIGTGGAPAHTPKPDCPNIVSTHQGLGYCKISISGNTLNYAMYRSPSNTVIDSFTITRP